MFLHLIYSGYLLMFIRWAHLQILIMAGVILHIHQHPKDLVKIVGPNLAASILSFNLGYESVFMMCWAAAMMAMVIYWLPCIDISEQLIQNWPMHLDSNMFSRIIILFILFSNMAFGFDRLTGGKFCKQIRGLGTKWNGRNKSSSRHTGCNRYS